MRLTILGSSGSLAGPSNPASGYLVEVDHLGVVLDLGPGTLAELQRITDPSLVHVAFSHLHADHCLDFPSLMVWRRFHPEAAAAGRSLLYGPSPAPVFFGRLSANDQPEGIDDMSDTFAFTPWRAHEPQQVERLTITPYPVVHPVEAYALRVVENSTGKTLTYSGDSAFTDELIAAAEGADIFLCEANWGAQDSSQVPGMHMNGQEAGMIAERAGVKRLVLVHVPPWIDPEDAVAAARTQYSGPVEFGLPRTVYEL